MFSAVLVNRELTDWFETTVVMSRVVVVTPFIMEALL